MEFYFFLVSPIFGIFGIIICWNNKRPVVAGFLIGYVFGIIGLIILMLMGPRTKKGISADYCESCGNKQIPTYKFCSNCGTKISHN